MANHSNFDVDEQSEKLKINSDEVTNNNVSRIDKSISRYEYLNPFMHRLDIDDKLDLAKIYVLTVLIIPIRTFLMITSVLAAWIFASIGHYGMTFEDITAKPLSGWRKKFQKLTAFSMRQLYGAGSFHYIKKIGQQASVKEAPILVIAPHSSYVDSLAVVCLGPPSIVAKQETSRIPIFGKLINFTQPIYVLREDPNSRQSTIQQIIDRSNSHEDWAQIAIFPEGTCTNRKALVTFKPGAFYPGVPVQPVVLRYPNKYDSFTWTWDGPGVLRLLWLTMAQFYSRFEIEFLPVYKPSEEEKINPKIFAANVQAVMARALNVPVANYSFEDCIVMNKAREMGVPYPSDIIEIEYSLHKLGLINSDIDESIVEDFHLTSNALNYTTFTRLFKINPNDEYAQRLFSLLDKNFTHHISLNDLLISLFFVKKQNEPIIEFLRLIKKLHCRSSYDMTRECFYNIVRFSSKISKEKTNELFVNIDVAHKGSISFDEFERHVKQLPQYKFLFKQKEVIRRNLK